MTEETVQPRAPRSILTRDVTGGRWRRFLTKWRRPIAIFALVFWLLMFWAALYLLSAQDFSEQQQRLSEDDMAQALLWLQIACQFYLPASGIVSAVMSIRGKRPGFFEEFACIIAALLIVMVIGLRLF